LLLSHVLDDDHSDQGTERSEDLVGPGAVNLSPAENPLNYSRPARGDGSRTFVRGALPHRILAATMVRRPRMNRSSPGTGAPPSTGGDRRKGALVQVAIAVVVSETLILLSGRVDVFAGRSGLEWLGVIVGLNLTASLLLAYFRFRGWDRAGSRAILADALTSLGGLAPLAAQAHPSTWIDLGNLFFVLFLAAKGALLVWFALVNADSFDTAPVRLWILATSLLLYAGATIPVARASQTDGDEPHYLLATHSLVADGDLDLANNYRRMDYLDFSPVELGVRHVLVNRRSQDVPIHDLGLSVLLVPGYALAGRRGAMFELNLIASLLALGIYDLARRLGASPAAAVRGWGLFAFTSPLLVYSSQIYPELVGGTLLVWTVIEFARARETSSAVPLVRAGVLLALLPWFSVRYWFLVLPLGLAILFWVISPVREPRRSVAGRAALLLLPGLASVALFALIDSRLYQSPVPNAGYVLYILRNRPPMFTPKLLDISLLGLLFDRAFGLLTTAPIYLIAIAGIAAAWKFSPPVAAAILITVAEFFVFAGINQYWYGGYAPPPRYIFPVVALLAGFAARGLEGRDPKPIVRFLAGWSLAVAVLYSAFPKTRLSSVNGRSSLGVFFDSTFGLDPAVAFPSFLRADPVDYALVALWGGAAIVCVRRMARQSRATQSPADVPPAPRAEPRPRTTAPSPERSEGPIPSG
jgi:hypothetical protein